MEGQLPFIPTFLRKNLLFIGLFTASIILIVVGLFQYLAPQTDEIEFIPAEANADVSEATTKIYVDVGGAVQKPGVYELNSTSRIQDALSAAQGLSADADREYISRSVNLAQPVVDGMKLYVPAVGEQVSGASSVGVSTQGSNQTTSTGFININSASSSELESLPKIGAVTAQKIIEGRPYAKIEDLVEKKVLGQKTFEAIKESISTF